MRNRFLLGFPEPLLRIHSFQSFFRNQLGEILKGTIVGFFRVLREATRRKLALGKVRVQAIATESPFIAGIGTVTFLFIGFDFAFHVENS